MLSSHYKRNNIINAEYYRCRAKFPKHSVSRGNSREHLPVHKSSISHIIKTSQEDNRNQPKHNFTYSSPNRTHKYCWLNSKALNCYRPQHDKYKYNLTQPEDRQKNVYNVYTRV